MALKGRKQASTAAQETVSAELVNVMNKLDVPKAPESNDYSKYEAMLANMHTDFASSMRVRIKTGRSLSEKMVAALDSMLVNWKNKPDYSKYFPMLDEVRQTDFTISMKDCIARGGILTEGMVQALDNMLARWQESKQPKPEPQKPSKIEVMVRVRKWMTTEQFDNPLPVMEMEGEVLQERGKMMQVRLQGSGRPSSYCRHCGRTITNPVSLFVGLGMKCGEHYGVDFTGGAAAINYEAVRQSMEKLLWEGWLPKSQITVTPIEELEPVELPDLKELAKADAKKKPKAKKRTTKSKKAGA